MVLLINRLNKENLLMLGLVEAKHRDSLSLLLLYVHGFSQLGWGLHTSSDYGRSWVIWGQMGSTDGTAQ